MPDKYLIEVTDPRLFVPGNEDVLAFIRRASPFAHTDVGSILVELGHSVAGAHAYSPSYKQCAYVVLHTDTWQVVAIAFHRWGLAFRFAPSSQAAALADGGAPAPEIGPDWVSFAPWGPNPPGDGGPPVSLERWCAQAVADAPAS